MIKKIRIFISSPGDVSEERKKACNVIERLQEDYIGKLELLPIFWESLPLSAGESFQEGIDFILSDDKGIDIAIFILWSRLGTPLGSMICKEDGSKYRSGTERELDLMMKAYIQSGKKRHPSILVYLRNDNDTFFENQKKAQTNEHQDNMNQKIDLDNFVQEYFYDSETKTNIRAFHTFDHPHTFSSRLITHLKGLLDNFVNEFDRAVPHWSINEYGSPYRGLEVFEMKHARIFRGRDHEICEIQQLLREQADKNKAFLLLVGASGSGKSSLVRAGVFPTIMKFDLDEQVSQWRIAIMTPNQSPEDLCHGLANALCVEDALPELVRNSDSIKDFGIGLRRDPVLAHKLILNAVEHISSNKIKILLLVDQLEELFINPEINKTDAGEFIHAIRVLSERGCVWVVATLRSDFYHKAQHFPDLMYLKEGAGQKDILPPKTASLRDIILDPAKLAGLSFENNIKSKEFLADKILNDAMQNPDALPLVEYTLHELFENRSEDGVLTFKQYEVLGGIEGAIGKRAEEIYSALSDESKRLVPRFFRSLASINSQGQFSSRSINAKEIITNEGMKEIIGRFLESRLVIIQKSTYDDSAIKIAHEALFKSWQRYDEWLSEAKIFLEIRQKLDFSIKRVLVENKSTLENYFAENRDLIKECDPLIDGSDLLPSEAEFIFRSSISSGYHTVEWSIRLKNEHSNIRLKVITEALKNENTTIRKNVVSLLALDPIEEVLDDVVKIAVLNQDDSVKREASKTLAKLDRSDLYQKIINSIKKSTYASGARTALSYIQVVADQKGQSPNFYGAIKQLKSLARKKIYWKSTVFRAKEFFIISPFLVIPTILFASISATIFKSIPGFFNWAISQADASFIMGAFHGASAGIIWAGIIVLGITTYFNVFGKENTRKSIFEPIGAIITGAFFGFFSSFFIVIVVLGVYQPESLAKMGWIITFEETDGYKRYNKIFWNDVFLITKFGWCYFITGTSLGIGIALTINYLHSSNQWSTFFINQKKIDSWYSLKKLVKSIMGIVFKHILPLVIMLTIGCIIAYIVPDIPANAEKYQQNGQIDLALSLIADCSTQAFGAYFAIVGLSLGLVMIKHGFQVKPVENI